MLKMVIYVNVLIIGATSGLGFNLGCKLLEKGHFVYFTTHTKKESLLVKEKLKANNFKKYECFFLDITNPKDRKKILDLPIDCLFCNGAMGLGGSLFDLSMDEIKKNFDVNVFSNLSLVKEYLEDSFRKKKFAKVIITASMAGLMPVPFMDSYSATKASLISFATTLYYEQKIFSLPYSIKVIEPGIYKTGFNEFMLSTVEENPYFSSDSFLNFERKVFQIISKKKYHSMVGKMVCAVESSSPKFIYRAPLSQKIFLKIYLLLFK